MARPSMACTGANNSTKKLCQNRWVPHLEQKWDIIVVLIDGDHDAFQALKTVGEQWVRSMAIDSVNLWTETFIIRQSVYCQRGKAVECLVMYSSAKKMCPSSSRFSLGGAKHPANRPRISLLESWVSYPSCLGVWAVIGFALHLCVKCN